MAEKNPSGQNVSKKLSIFLTADSAFLAPNNELLDKMYTGLYILFFLILASRSFCYSTYQDDKTLSGYKLCTHDDLVCKKINWSN